MASHHQDSPNSHSTGSHGAQAAHGTVKLYVVFAVILSVITFFEWLIFKKRVEMGISNTVLIISLLAMSFVKFGMVVGWYMHLRYDIKFLTQMFASSLVVATAIMIVVSLLAAH